jgi:hypothetical protein
VVPTQLRFFEPSRELRATAFALGCLWLQYWRVCPSLALWALVLAMFAALAFYAFGDYICALPSQG